MDKERDVINNPLNPIRQLFCKHNYQWYRAQGLFFNLSGERQYKICSKCGKRAGSRFIRNWDGS